MYNQQLHLQINDDIEPLGLDIAGEDNGFYARLISNANDIQSLYHALYSRHPAGSACFDRLISTISNAYAQRPSVLRSRDVAKLQQNHWYCSHKLMGMSLYTDRFCGTLSAIPVKLPYFKELGVNLLHLMPIFKSPEGESDGGYAVSDFRQVDKKFGTLQHLKVLQQQMMDQGMYLMLDIVLNHTSQQHEWAQKAREGDPFYRDFFYTYPNRLLPDRFEEAMPDVFPESAPGNFTWVEEMQCWVMTVFHNYQWDLNFSNPEVLLAMLEHIFFYANLGVDVLRIDAPAFIWKQMGTTCQNLPEAHTLLRLIRQCVEVTAPGMALLGEAIVAPEEIMQYFGTEQYAGRECHFAYNATHMALQWDMLATGDSSVMLAAQHLLLQKPAGASWITYTRCHDDIGLGYSDAMISNAGYNPYEHRRFLKDYYSGAYNGSPARGSLFGVNPKTQDARISGTLASLCGLEAALETNDKHSVETAIQKILLMQAHSFLLGGLPMLFYGDELGYTNDYSYLHDPGKSYDNRWMHRPVMDWHKNSQRKVAGSIENRIFSGTQQLISLRQSHELLDDEGNLRWMNTQNKHLAGFLRYKGGQRLYCIFNFSDKEARIAWLAFRESGCSAPELTDLWTGNVYVPGRDNDFVALKPYGFVLLAEYGC